MGKVREFAELFERFDLEVKSLHDFPHIEEVEETGETFEENAILKADSLSRQLNAIVIADDSGLIVDALNGKRACIQLVLLESRKMIKRILIKFYKN